MKQLYIIEAAKTLRKMAELTANNSKNWENYENICHTMIDTAYNAHKDEILALREQIAKLEAQNLHDSWRTNPDRVGR